MRKAIGLFLLIGLFSVLFTHCKKQKYNKNGLVELNNFGENPGNLKSYYYQPINASTDMPMVVVLHGCTQNVAQLVKLTEWNRLADEYGFYVLYPEQKRINNASKCFNWFQSKDFEKDEGENASIKNMVEAMNDKFEIDQNQIYLTGLSAGAAMGMIMVSNYPDIFKGASIMSGGPYKSAKGLNDSFKALRGKVQKSSEDWGNLVREVNPNYQGDYAKLIVFHGKKDPVVDFKNSQEIIKQWSNVLGINLNNKIESNPSDDIKRIDYKSQNNEILLTKIEISKMGHALAVDKGDGVEKGGGNGIFSKDKGYFSTYWTLKFFNLIP